METIKQQSKMRKRLSLVGRILDDIFMPTSQIRWANELNIEPKYKLMAYTGAIVAETARLYMYYMAMHEGGLI